MQYKDTNVYWLEAANADVFLWRAERWEKQSLVAGGAIVTVFVLSKWKALSSLLSINTNTNTKEAHEQQ